MKTQIRPLLLALLVALAAVWPAHAQTGSRPLMDSLSTLPDSEMLLYVNAPRIVNDAMPRLLPEKDLKDMQSGIDALKAFVNVDIRNMEYMVLAMRFNKPTGTTLFPMPEVMFAARGDFDAKALLAMGNAMSEKKLVEEKVGDHTLYLLKLGDVAPGATKNPFGAAFSEIGLTTLDDHTLAVGNMSYIRAALEAADGRGGRIKPERLTSLLREPNALISMTGSPLMAFARSFGLRMAENPDPNCMTQFGEFYMALNMDAQNFRLTGAMNADNPNTAVMMRNMFSGILQQGRSSVPDKNAQTIFDQIKLFTEGSELMVEALVPQEMAAKLIKDMLAPKPKASAPAKKETAPTVEEKKPAQPKAKPRKSKSTR